MDSSDAGLRVLLHKEAHYIVAQCVDIDVAAQGDTEKEAIDAFVEAFLRHIIVSVEFHLHPLLDAPRPPAEYAKRWESAVLRSPGPPRTVEIPRFTIYKDQVVEAAEFDIPRRAVLVG